jgi:hypothetical protein
MGKFNKNLDATFNPPRKWVLNSALSYDCDDLTEQEIDTLKAVGIPITKSGKITVKKGFVTDLASVPRAMWGIISPYDLARAAIIHDQLYKQIRQHRWSHLQDNDFETDIERRAIVQAKAVADKIFLCASNDAVPKVPAWKCNAAYYAVRAFGRWSIVPNVDNI